MSIISGLRARNDVGRCASRLLSNPHPDNAVATIARVAAIGIGLFPACARRSWTDFQISQSAPVIKHRNFGITLLLCGADRYCPFSAGVICIFECVPYIGSTPGVKRASEPIRIAGGGCGG